MIGFLVAGFVVGTLARRRQARQGEYVDLLATIGLGVVGSVVGGLVAWLLGAGRVFELDVVGLVLAVVVAVLFIGVAEGIAVRNKSTA